jgi:hypothetical protein
MCAEVDHVELIERLNRDFDAWALSTGAVQLPYVLAAVNAAHGYDGRIAGELPDWRGWQETAPAGYRIGVWVKPLVFFKPGVNPAYSWEPVIWKGGRRRTRKQATTYDYVVANATFGKGIHGTKPAGFWSWLFETLNLEPQDKFTDVFPGSGGGMVAWNAWRKTRQIELAYVHDSGGP